jgi:hypothetical protein
MDTIPTSVGRQDEIVVFLGPSLSITRARLMLNACFLPPADRGAVHRALTVDPRMIVLIDGVFHGSPSVWQRELLDAIEDGITVIGAASMGALRAAEMAPFGMIGCGQVYRWYREGVIEADDEVALLHGDAESGYRTLSEPLVNIRATVTAAVRSNCLTNGQAEAFIEHARQLHYVDRCWPGLLNSSATARWPYAVIQRLAGFVATRRRDIKRADARTALRLAGRLRAAAPPARPAATVPTSALGLRKSARALHTTVPGPDGPAPVTEILRRARRNRPDLIKRLRARVAQRFFITEWARHHHVHCPQTELNRFACRWERRHNLDVTNGWMRANGLTHALYSRLIAERAFAEWVVEHARTAPALQDADPVLRMTFHTAGKEIEVADRLVLAWAVYAGALTTPPATLPERRMASAWIVERGPAHFGLPWNETQVLVEELQVTGAAASLAAGRWTVEVA